MDFLWPSVGRTGALSETGASTFSLFSSDGTASDTTAGEAGIVLKRLRPGTAAFRRDEEDKGLVRAVEGIVDREVGVDGVLRVPPGLVTEGRDAAEIGFLAGVEAVIVLEVDVLSAVVGGATDILLGLADMPSFVWSSAPSTELSEVCFR